MLPFIAYNLLLVGILGQFASDPSYWFIHSDSSLNYKI